MTTENKFFIDTVDYKQYQLFCEKTPSVFMPQSDDPRLKEILDLVDQVTPGKAPTVETPCLFLTYYANAYFGIAQCCQIDAIRSNIGQIEDKRTRYVLLTMLMSVMSASASTTTHFAQYLKVKSKATCNNLIGKRKINIIESCKSLLAEYRQAGLCTADRKAPSVCYNLDFSDCLDSISLNNETLVYADPPYFKEHYSRYYHVLNTVCLYDYPAMAMNPQTHELSIGRYREDRSVSDFGKKAKALGAFDTLITKCSNAGAWLMISYSDNSIVDISDIQALAEKKYDVLIEKVELSHSKQGRSSISKVDEYIFICRPKKIVHDVDEKLSVIKELKPIVDNPAGFMHNYMARKPYNVVSEIIKRFCPDGGCVYDPMFGSGTTIIEASKLGRKAIGTDINLLAYKLCKASLTRWNLSKVEEVIDRYKENGIQYLYHDDVLKLFCTLLDNAKFRRVFSDKYPLILIDEYQDSYSPIIERFIKYFIAEEKGPQFGFFGDAWQTIYQSNKACGVIEHDMIEFDGTHGLSAYNKTDQEKYEGSDSTFISPKYVQTIESKPVSEWIIAVGKHEGFIPSEQLHLHRNIGEW